MKTEKASRRLRSLSAKSVIVPAVLLIVLLHALLVWSTVRVNQASRLLAESMQRNLICSEMISDFSRGADQLNTLAIQWVNSGRTQVLDDYVAQLQSVRETADSISVFLGDNGFANERDKVSGAMEAVEQRADVEKKAIRMAAQAMNKDLSAYPELAEIHLSEEEESLMPARLLERAASRFNMGGYPALRGEIQRNLGMLQAVLNQTTGQEIASRSAVIARYRGTQWSLIAIVIVVLVTMSGLLFVLMLLPLERSVELVQQGKAVSATTGFSELRHLAGAYDELLITRDALEADLRRASVTDALTGLLNRTAFQEFIGKLQDKPERTALTVFSLDVNGLKTINDQRGHVFGDMLLCDAAACILNALGRGEGRECFRFGGDEFAVIWVNIPEEEIAKALVQFHREQLRRDVSVSCGWARTADLSSTSVRQLFEEADKQMYENKASLKLASGG